MAAILENGGHIFTLNPHLFIFSTSVLVSSSSSSNFTYLISEGLAFKSVYILSGYDIYYDLAAILKNGRHLEISGG